MGVCWILDHQILCFFAVAAPLSAFFLVRFAAVLAVVLGSCGRRQEEEEEEGKKKERKEKKKKKKEKEKNSIQCSDEARLKEFGAMRRKPNRRGKFRHNLTITSRLQTTCPSPRAFRDMAAQ